MSNDSELTRIPKHVSDAAVRNKITVILATLTTAETNLAAIKTSVDASKTGGVGLTDPQTGTLQTAVDLASTTLAAVRTAVTASGL